MPLYGRSNYERYWLQFATKRIILNSVLVDDTIFGEVPELLFRLSPQMIPPSLLDWNPFVTSRQLLSNDNGHLEISIQRIKPVEILLQAIRDNRWKFRSFLRVIPCVKWLSSKSKLERLLLKFVDAIVSTSTMKLLPDRLLKMY